MMVIGSFRLATRLGQERHQHLSSLIMFQIRQKISQNFDGRSRRLFLSVTINLYLEAT